MKITFNGVEISNTVRISVEAIDNFSKPIGNLAADFSGFVLMLKGYKIVNQRGRKKLVEIQA